MPRQLFEDPYAAQAIELLQGPARARAEAVRQVAEAQARAATTTGNAQAGAQIAGGNAAAGAAQQIGQSVGQIPNDILRAQQQSQQLQLGKLQQANQQQELGLRQQEFQRKSELQAAQKQIGQMMSNPDLLDPDTGLLNAKSIAASMSKANANYNGPSEPPDMAKIYSIIDPINESISKAQESQRVAAEHKTNALAHIASEAYNSGTQNGGDFFTPAKLSLAAAIKSGLITQDQADQMLAPMIDNKDQIPQYLKDVARRSTVKRNIVFGKPGEVGFENGVAVPGMAVPEKADKPVVVNGQLLNPNNGARIGEPVPPQQSPNEAETIRHNQAMEKISTMNAGRESAAQQETMRHNRASEAAANPFGSMPTGAGAAAGTQGPTGDDYLKTMPPAQAGQIKALAEGRTPFPTGMSYAKLQPLIQAVTQYDPTFDAANYTARSKARSDLTSPNGTGGKTINALNTAVQHVGKLSDLIEALDNGNIPAVNAVSNWLSKASGGTQVTNFQAVQPQMMKEIERLWRGAGGSTADIESLKASLGPNMGIQQQREALSNFVDLIKGKLDSTETQRNNILGPAAKDVPILFDQNKSVIEKVAGRAGGEKNQSDGTLTFTRDAKGNIVKQ